MQSVRIIILVIIMALISGLMSFFQLVKLEVFLKFPDRYVEIYKNSGAFPASPLMLWDGSVYGFAHSAIVFFTFFPLFLLTWILSAGQRAVYTFPIQPITNILTPESERNFSRAALTDFLVKTCRLPSCKHRLETYNGGNATDLEDDGEVGKELTSYQEYIFLTTAGGARSSDAEVIADCLYDAGIRAVQELILFVKTGDEEFYKIPGVSMGAAAQIIWAVNSDLDEIWYKPPRHPAYFSLKGEDDYDKYVQTPPKKVSDKKYNHNGLKMLMPIENRITPEQRANRRKDKANETLRTRGNDLVRVQTPLAWNGYLCEYVPVTECMLEPTGNVRVRPFSDFELLSKKELVEAKHKKAWMDWGIILVDK